MGCVRICRVLALIVSVAIRAGPRIARKGWTGQETTRCHACLSDGYRLHELEPVLYWPDFDPTLTPAVYGGLLFLSRPVL